MTNPTKWTDANVFSVRPVPKDGGVISNDTKVKCPGIGKNGAPMPNLAIRFRNGNPVGVFSYYYSVRGRDQVKAIGKVGSMLLADVVKACHGFAAMVSDKKSPIIEEAKVSAKAGQVLRLALPGFKDYLRKLGRTEAYVGDVDRNINRMTTLLPLQLGEIDRGMVATQLNKVEEKHGERQAGTARAHLSSLYTYAMRELGYLGINPVQGTRNRASKKRARVLDQHEIVLLWKATEEPSQFNTIVRLLLLTGSRLDMMADLRKSELVKLSHGRIEIPAVRMKTPHDFWVGLSTQTLAILTQVKDQRADSDFVFGTGQGGFSGYNKSMERLRARMVELNEGKEIPHWVLHDLRRTLVTLGVDQAKLDTLSLQLCLSHKGGGVRDGAEGNYNYAMYIDQKTRALQGWADYVDSLVGNSPQPEKEGRPNLRLVA